MFSTERLALKAGGWLLVNALGIAIYLSLESWILAPRPEAEALNGIDQIYFWLTRNLPLLIVFIVLNVIWLIRIWRRTDPSNMWPFRSWLLVCLAWAIALVYHGLAVKILTNGPCLPRFCFHVWPNHATLPFHD